MPETVDILGNPTCPAEAQPSILARAAALFTAPAGLDRMGAVRTSTRQRAFEICEWSATKGRPLRVLWGKVGNPSNVEHYGGYGVDFMTFSNAALSKHDRAIGDGIVEYALANRTRLKVKGIIWRQRRIGYSSGWGSWVNMADRGSATANHYDHVHILFEAADYTPPGPVTPPVKLPTYYVDPSKVDTFLWSVRDSTGETVHQRPPGFPITTAVELVTRNGKRWVKTKAGYRYALDYLTTTKPDVPKPDVPKPDPEPSVKHQLSVVTANVFRRTELPRAGGPWSKRKSSIVAAIKSGSPDLVLGMELDSTTAADIAAGLGSGWAYDRCKGIGIFWRQSVIERTAPGVPVLYPDKDNRYLFYVPLRHKSSGIDFRAAVTHLENDGGGTGDHGHIRRNVEMKEFVKRTAASGRWVFGADLNSTTRSSGGTTARGRQKPRPMLKAAGWWLLSDQSGVVNRAKESHHGGGKGSSDDGAWIDDCGGKGGIRYVSGKLILTDNTDASDHNFLQMTVVL